VVSGNQLTSSLTAGQFVKAVSSFCGPFIAAFAASVMGNWQMIFPGYAVITLIASIWLMLTPITETALSKNNSGFGDVLGLLKDKVILLLFLGILFVVGVDVGLNTAAPKILMERCGLSSINAGYGPSVYFAFRTAGAFIGAFLLAKVAPVKFYKTNIIIAVLALLALLFVQDKWAIFGLYAVVGFTVANIFPILYAAALQRKPDHANEISGLMITGVFGGAVIPFLMGLSSDALHTQVGSVLVILASALYLLFCAFRLKH
jgi:fucose permease